MPAPGLPGAGRIPLSGLREEMGLSQREQQVMDRDDPLRGSLTPGAASPAVERAGAERAARHSLRGQIARLEHELSAIVADSFPRISPAPAAGGVPAGAVRAAGPSLLGLGELE